MPRAYELKKRAERQDETRRRIVEATIELHQTIGPNATSMADDRRASGGRPGHRVPPLPRRAHARAGLQRPLPRSDTPRPTRRRGRRSRNRSSACEQACATPTPTTARPRRCSRACSPTLVTTPWSSRTTRTGDTPPTSWRNPGALRGRQRTLLRAGIGLALSFDTWRTLRREQGLSDRRPSSSCSGLPATKLAVQPDAGEERAARDAVAPYTPLNGHGCRGAAPADG